MERNYWWTALAITTVCIGIMEMFKIFFLIKTALLNVNGVLKRIKSESYFILQGSLAKVKDISVPVICTCVLSFQIDLEVRKYLSAVAVILACFKFMLQLSRLPKIGLYIFMLNKVFMTIMNFFISYSWHFFGYAIAFHIVMPKDGPFATLTDSIIKVNISEIFLSQLN